MQRFFYYEYVCISESLRLNRYNVQYLSTCVTDHCDNLEIFQALSRIPFSGRWRHTLVDVTNIR